jgi:hypothetical protein
LPGPAFDLAETLGAGHRAAQDDQQDFREGVDNLSGLTGVVERGKMIKKRLLLHRRPR